MKAFAALYGLKHITSIPHYPQSNGQAERTVKTVKGLLQDSPDIFLLLLSYCATPLPCCGLSPGELLMDRRLRTDVPETKRHLTPNCPHLQGFLEKDKEMKQKQKEGMTGSTEYALSQHCQTTLQYGSTPKVAKCLEESSQLQTPHAPMWWRSPLVVASEGTALLCQPVQRTLPHLPSTQQTTLLAAEQPDPKQAYPFDLLIA